MDASDAVLATRSEDALKLRSAGEVGTPPAGDRAGRSEIPRRRVPVIEPTAAELWAAHAGAAWSDDVPRVPPPPDEQEIPQNSAEVILSPGAEAARREAAAAARRRAPEEIVLGVALAPEPEGVMVTLPEAVQDSVLETVPGTVSEDALETVLAV